MAFPAGLTTCVVTAGSTLNFGGMDGSITLTVTPVLGGNASHITWSASGQPLVAFSDSNSADAGTVAQVVVPHVDQAGFIDGSGNAATMWSYRATITAKVGRESKQWFKSFQPLQGQDTIDLDLLPDGSITSPTSAPIPAVTSVNGQTGAVTVASGVDDATLAGMVTDTGTQVGAALAGAYAGKGSQRTATTVRSSYVTSTADDALRGFSATTGLSAATDGIDATTAGTNGYGILPLFAKQSHLSFRVKCAKATTGSNAVVGVSITDPGTLPTDANRMWGFGYVQGSGLCWTRPNVGADVVAVADANIADGDEYDVSIFFDGSMTPAAAGTPKNKVISARYHRVGDDPINDGYNRVLMREDFYDPGNLVVRTNAAGALTALTASIPATGEIGYGSAVGDGVYGAASDGVMVHIPRKPNGLAVIASHGHGSSIYGSGWSVTYQRAVWERLTATGYTVFIPSEGGNLWGNDAVMAMLSDLHASIVTDWGLDPNVFLWGDSMGGGATLTAIGKQVLPVRAAYVTEPVCDLSLLWDNPDFTTLPAAYSNDTALRDANNPMLLPVENYAGVPILFASSPDDTIAVKTANTDAMVARISGVTETAVFVNSGPHADPKAYRPVDPASWFGSHV